jgi:hypothetical protein
MSDGGARCERCGKAEPMPLPMPADAFTPWCEFVGAVHRGCKDTGRVDVAAQSVGDWIHGHDTGISSKAIYRHMMGIPRDDRDWRFGNYPLDPSDFGRCYRLLQIAPNWRNRIGEMAKYGKQWAALAGAWDELTAMWETVIESKAKLAPELYDRMKELTA